MLQLKGEKQTVFFSKTGALAGFRDAAGRDFIEKDLNSRPLFRIGCAEFIDGIRQPGDLILSSALSVPEVQAEKGKIIFRYVSLGGFAIHVCCIIEINEEDGLCHFSIKIDNNSLLGLHFVEYPVIECPVAIGEDAAEDRIVLPKQDGYLLPSPAFMPWQGDLPHRAWDQRFEYPGNGREFPENISAQMMAYYDKNSGMYIAIHDGSGHPKKIGPVWHKDEILETIEFTPYFYISPEQGNQYAPSYDVVVGCFTGDWKDAADIYKEFAIRQEWCRKKITERADIPGWIKKGALFFNIRLRGQKFENYEEVLPAYLEDWQNIWGVPLVAMMCGWEKLGEWIGPDYFPPYGGKEAFQQLCRELKKKNIVPFPFGLSGLKLPVRKWIGKDWPQPQLAIDYDNRRTFASKLRQYAATDASDQIIMDSPVNSWDGMHAYACVMTKQAEKQLFGASMELVKEYGVQIVQADQLFGGGVTECYDSGHGHPPGRGKWQIDRVAKLYDTIRETGKKFDSDFALSQEFMSELFIQHLDICHARVFDEPRGLQGIPLFAYLYHEYLPCYGGDWSSQLSDNTCGIYNHAANFVFGSLPAACPQTMQVSMLNESPEKCDNNILAMGKNCCYLHCHFPEFFIEGRMQRCAELAVPLIDVRFTGLNFSGWMKGVDRRPSVLYCKWKAPDGKCAYALANISGEVQKISICDEKMSEEMLLWINREPAVEIGKTNGHIEFKLPALAAAVVTEK